MDLPFVIQVIIGEYYHSKCAVHSDMCDPKCRRKFAVHLFTVCPYYNGTASTMYPSVSNTTSIDSLRKLMNLLCQTYG